VYVEDRKKLEVKNDFLKFLCREKKMALGKEIFAKCFFICREFFI
jgi:hypothetical protein